MTNFSTNCSPTTITIAALLSFIYEAARADAAVPPEKVAKSVQRFFDAEEGFSAGDLIVASQFREMQAYIRKTLGPCAVTSPRMLRRVMADRSALSRYFYAKNGKKVLRAAAEIIGGYAALDELTRTTGSRRVFDQAVTESDPEILVSAVRKHGTTEDDAAEVAYEQDSARSGKSESGADPSTVRQSRMRIYTVDELVEIVLQSSASPKTIRRQE